MLQQIHVVALRVLLVPRLLARVRWDILGPYRASRGVAKNDERIPENAGRHSKALRCLSVHEVYMRPSSPI